MLPCCHHRRYQATLVAMAAAVVMYFCVHIEAVGLTTAATMTSKTWCPSGCVKVLPTTRRVLAKCNANYRERRQLGLGRRGTIETFGWKLPAIWLASLRNYGALADEKIRESDVKSIFVAGASGSTGREIVRYIRERYPGVQVVAGVRNLDKAKKLGFYDNGIQVREFNVLDPTDKLIQAVKGTDAIICATGFVPSNPFEFKKLAHEVDNEGTIRLVKASKAAGIPKFVLVSSILTNGRAIGQEKNPGFVITNAFGGVLDEKLQAEYFLRKSGLDFTIVRPGGLKDSTSIGKIVATLEDQTFTGEISRELVAQVMVEATLDPLSSNKVIEIIEDDSGTSAENVFKSLKV